MKKITLSKKEAFQAGLEGLFRRIRSVYGGYKHRNGTPDEHIQSMFKNINGALGELAVAKYFNTYWNGGDIGTADIEGFPDPIEVRTTHYKTGRCWVNKTDKDGIYILVTGTMPEFTIVGWIYSKEAKKEEYLEKCKSSNDYTYYVPRDKMRDIEFLKQNMKNIDISC